MKRICFVFIISLCLAAQVSAEPNSKAALLKTQLKAVDSVTNGILTLYIDKDSPYAGTFTVATGPDHPHPNENVLYGGSLRVPGTSYLTVRSYTSRTDYISSGGSPSSDFQVVKLHNYLQSVARIGNTGYKTVWVVRGNDALTIEQLTVIEGTTLDDTLVRVTTTVKNDGSSPVKIGIRYEWDWKIDNSDNSVIKRHNPDDEDFTSEFFEETPPHFEYYEETGISGSEPGPGITGGTYLDWSVFGSVNGPSALDPPPTPPDRFNYSSWWSAYLNAWTFQVTGGGTDSAVCYYWGDTESNAIVLAPGESYTVTQYITTFKKALKPKPATPKPVNAPTLTQWGLILLILSICTMALLKLGGAER